jgi:ubiquinone/menaquinone biosynthesis C-methylase UbiE
MNHLKQTVSSSKNVIYFADGVQYEGFRPTYPPLFIDKLLDNTKNFGNFLDVATGTGQLLFQICDKFKGLSVGTDISESQIVQARKKAESLKSTLQGDQKIQFLVGDSSNLDKFLEENNVHTKFDLITFAEAFHWFDMEKVLIACKEKLLTKEGLLGILSYYIKGVQLNSSDEEVQNRCIKNYDELYDTVMVESKFSQDVLLSGYKDVPFEKYFSTTRESYVVKVPVDLNWVIGHISTWSMYNLYVKNRQHQKDFKDPLQVYKEILIQEANKAEKEQKILEKDKPYLMVIPFNLILAKNN